MVRDGYFYAAPLIAAGILLGWLAFQLTDSPFMVGLAAFARSAPLRVLGPFTGLVADRMHRGRVPLSQRVQGSSP